jgi:hypothetical protein
MAPLLRPPLIEPRADKATAQTFSAQGIRPHLLRSSLSLLAFLVLVSAAHFPSRAQVSSAPPSTQALPRVSSSTVPLPSGLAPVSELAVEGSRLALDSNGTLFRSDDQGKHWRQIRQQWAGKAVELLGIPRLPAAAHSGPEAKLKSGQEDYAAVLLRSTPAFHWISVDRGKTWTSANPEEQRASNVKWSGE